MQLSANVNFDERIEFVKERTATAMYAFWSAMLTAHTVLLSVAVALSTATPLAVVWQFKLIGFMAMTSMVLLLLNFASVRMQYEAIGQRLLNFEADLSDKQLTSDITTAHTRRRLIRVVELVSALGLAIEAGLFAWILIA